MYVGLVCGGVGCEGLVCVGRWRNVCGGLGCGCVCVGLGCVGGRRGVWGWAVCVGGVGSVDVRGWGEWGCVYMWGLGWVSGWGCVYVGAGGVGGVGGD